MKLPMGSRQVSRITCKSQEKSARNRPPVVLATVFRRDSTAGAEQILGIHLLLVGDSAVDSGERAEVLFFTQQLRKV